VSIVSVRIIAPGPGDKPPYELLLLADPDRAAVERYVAKGARFEARTGRDTVGVAILLPLDHETSELMNISVSPAYQGTGLGKQLLRHCINAASEAGYERITVGTGNSSLGQLAFYQKAGFRIIGIVPNHFVENYAEPIIENGIHCQDMVPLSLEFTRQCGAQSPRGSQR
jgi:ribosomal protein S18 acetylase RimI-like enzyme